MIALALILWAAAWAYGPPPPPPPGAPDCTRGVRPPFIGGPSPA